VDRKKFAIVAALLLIGVGAALWWSRGGSGASPTAEGAKNAPAPSAPTPPAPAVPAPAQAATPQAEPDPYESTEPRPTLGLRPAHARKSHDTRQLTPEELEKYAPELKKYQDAWAKYVEPLLYPAGHPQEGMYRDGICLDEAVAAQLDYYEAVNPPGYMDEPRLHVQRRLRYEVVRDLQANWDQTDLASTRALYDGLMAAPEDPNALLSDIWLPATPTDQAATSRREYMEKRLRHREGPIFRKRGCPVG
jgi:hypothetical protein